MSDVPGRLREEAIAETYVDWELLEEAADLIEQQQREIGRLKECCDWLRKVASEQSPQTSLAEHDAALFETASIPRHAKAGCIGEFEVFVEDGNVCPECIQEYNPDCEVCMGESNENGACDLVVDVPWDICKEIWKAMNKIKAEELRNGKDGE